jgi:hypothetical protein
MRAREGVDLSLALRKEYMTIIRVERTLGDSTKYRLVNHLNRGSLFDSIWIGHPTNSCICTLGAFNDPSLIYTCEDNDLLIRLLTSCCIFDRTLGKLISKGRDQLNEKEI